PLRRVSAKVDAPDPGARPGRCCPAARRDRVRDPRSRGRACREIDVSERWSALGNVYVVHERHGGHLTPDGVRALCAAGADGVVEVVDRSDDEVDVVIWNRDGSTAELSGNGTRIAARWLAERTGAGRVTVRVGARRVLA